MYFKPLILAGALALATTAEARDVTDMLGRTITVPDEIGSVITLGSVPVINSFVFATGNADLVASDLPVRFRQRGRWIWQDVFAPQLATNAQVQDTEGGPALEAILTLNPDLAISFSQEVADLLEANGIPTFMPRIHTPEDVKAAVDMLGDMFGNETVGEEYAAWFDAALAEVAGRLEGVEDRPSVLYLSPRNMTQPHLVAEWWITAGGGASVTNDGRTTETLSLSTETVLAADPDFLILGDPAHIELVKEDANLSTLRAVQEGNIMVSPVGAHIWANRTVEQPLTVLWAASNFHPDLFPEAELIERVSEFYATFFKVNLTDEQVKSILSGRATKQ
ncbi:MAG: ABC transporter substrate-binding protein [Tropicimonas sp.]|uniref:ABC transporter substrate-binding protein n=1 Tax=Tropicimonas sp. TaxID=2067044 RepID=UPI003A888942